MIPSFVPKFYPTDSNIFSLKSFTFELAFPFLKFFPLGQEFDQYLEDISWSTFVPQYWETYPSSGKILDMPLQVLHFGLCPINN